MQSEHWILVNYHQEIGCLFPSLGSLYSAFCTNTILIPLLRFKIWPWFLKIFENKYINPVFELDLRELHSAVGCGGSGSSGVKGWYQWLHATSSYCIWVCNMLALNSEIGKREVFKKCLHQVKLLCYYVDLIRTTKKKQWRAGEMARCLRAHTALAEN